MFGKFPNDLPGIILQNTYTITYGVNTSGGYVVMLYFVWIFSIGAIFSQSTRANGPRVTQQDPKMIPRLMNVYLIF